MSVVTTTVTDKLTTLDPSFFLTLDYFVYYEFATLRYVTRIFIQVMKYGG